MCAAMNVSSKSGIHRLVTALELRGFIRRIPECARTIEVLRLPNGSVPESLIRQYESEIFKLSDENHDLRQRLSRYESRPV